MSNETCAATPTGLPGTQPRWLATAVPSRHFIPSDAPVCPGSRHSHPVGRRTSGDMSPGIGALNLVGPLHGQLQRATLLRSSLESTRLQFVFLPTLPSPRKLAF